MRRRRTVLALTALVLVSAAARYAASTGFRVPWISPDEEIYTLLGRSFWQHGSFSILGEPAPYYSLLYPLLAGLPLAVAGVSNGLELLQVMQALVMSSAAVPVFLWGRTLMRPRWALAAAALTVCVPALAYSGLAMSETLFYPLTIWALWALARALERPTPVRQGVFALAAVAAVATRLQAVVLVPTLFVAVALLALFTRRRDVFRPFLPAFAAVAVLALGWAALNVVGSGSWRAVLGAYATVGASDYQFSRWLSFLEWHVADLFLITLGVPVLALLVLLGPALRGRERDERAAVLLATTLAYTALLAVEVALFASRFVGHLAERQLVTAAPPLFLAFGLWLERRAPRPQPWTSIAAAALAIPVVLLPVRVLSNDLTAHNAFMTIPLAKLQEHATSSILETAYAVLAAVVVAAFVLVPARWAPALIVLVATGLLAASAFATAEVGRLSRKERASVFAGAPTDWVDRAAGRRPVTVFVTGERAATDLWQHLFWNDRIERVVDSPGYVVPGPLPQATAVPSVRGVLRTQRTLRADLVLTTPSITLEGERIAGIGTSDQPGLNLWRVDGPMRLSTTTEGVLPNGDIVGPAKVRVFACGPGRLELTLLGKQGKPLRVLRNGEQLLQRTIPSGAVAHLSLPAPPDADGSGFCVYELVSEGLLGSTRIEYVRE
jgi:hypothetical protein